MELKSRSFEDYWRELESKDPDFLSILDLLQNKFGWDVSLTPDEKETTARLINLTIKATKEHLKSK